MSSVDDLFLPWPEDAGSYQADEIHRLYEAGYCGAKPDPQAAERLEQAILDLGGDPDGAAVAHAAGYADSGAGKLIIPHVQVLKYFPDCWPGPAQERGDCFVAGTQVLGETTKPIEDVQIGDRVWTAEGKLAEVVSTRKLTTLRPLVRVHITGHTPLVCTADHKLLVYRLSRVGGKRVTAAYYRRAKASRLGVAKAVSAVYEDREPAWVSAGDLVDTDYLLTPINFDAVSMPAESPRDIMATEEGRWVLGYFLGNGYAGGNSAEWTTPKSGAALRIAAFLANAGWNVHPITPQRGGLRVRVSDRKLVRWLREQFYRGKQKNFPGWGVGLRSFVGGLIAADGFSRGPSHYFDSISKSLVWGVYASVTQWGYEPTVAECARSKGTYANAKPLYRVIWRDEKQKSLLWRDEQFSCRPVAKVEFLEGEHEVFDIGIADEHHSFIADGLAAHNCVSHGTKNASLISLCGDIFNAKPDEETGQLEGVPEVSEEGIRNGVLSSEWLYWWRGYNGDGWSGEAGAQAAIDHGIMLRQAYPDLGIDLTRYSGGLAGKFGRQAPPSNMAAEGKKHHLRNVTVLRSPEEVRDFLHNFYGVTECSTLAGDKRDENGVSRLKAIGGHCQCISGYDDRDEIKQKYGEPLALLTNSWGGNWISGGRKILGTDIEIPEGSHWFKVSQLRNMSLLALSSVAGWPSRRPPPPADLFT